ncbi:tetratricopeptide repeat protein [Microcoleus sp. Pol7_A1]|uniref:tetratricopeptide repeat protein n=1 Tax=Microcoleus sp. Pol7_A1 TaxID=2818893 RepID=UPI002FD2BE90
MLYKFKKNQFLTAAAAASLLTVAPVCAANISLPVPAESPVNNSLVQNTGANEYFQQGLNFAAQQNRASAEAAFRRVIQIDPNFAEAYANLGSILANQNKLTEALPNFETAIRLKPNVPEFYYMLGQVLYAQNKRAEAVESVKKARDLFRNQGKTQEANTLDLVIKDISK